MTRKDLPRTFAAALALLDGRYSRVIAHNTHLRREGRGAVAVVLHATPVVTFYPNGRIDLCTGGWYTATTKDRMNRCLPGTWRVSSDQRRGGWGLYHAGVRVRDFAGSAVTLAPADTRRDNV